MAAELSPAQLIAAKGDTLAGTGANALAKVAVGADGQVLTADSTQTAGVKWAPGGTGSSVDASSTVKGITKLSVDPASAANPIAVGVNDPTYTGHAPLASPALTGNPTAPTQAPGTNSTRLASTAYADAAVSVEATARSNADALLAPLASPALTGTPTVPTAAAADNTTKAASTAYVRGEVSTEATARSNADALLAPLASPALTGTPTVPTAAGGTNTTQAASTAYVQTELAALVTLSPATAARNTIQPSADVVPLTLKGKVSQTAHLLDLTDSAGNVLAQFSSAGNLSGRSGQNYTVETLGGGVLLLRSTSAGAVTALTGQVNMQDSGGAATTFQVNTADKGAATVRVILKAQAAQSVDIFQVQNSGATPQTGFSSGGLFRWIAAGNVQTTVGAAGAASALPATPTKYLKVVDDAGTTLVIPAYAAV